MLPIPQLGTNDDFLISANGHIEFEISKSAIAEGITYLAPNSTHLISKMESPNRLLLPSAEKDCESSGDERDFLRARNHSLVDDDESSNDGSPNSSPLIESFEPETRVGTSRKRTASDAQLSGFCRKGTRFKALFDDAVARIVSNSGGNTIARETSTKQASLFETHQFSKDLQGAADVARDKTAQVILLRKQLDKAAVDSSVIEAANKELRQSLKDAEQRLERTTNALRVAGQNASNARVDADAAEATAASLASQLEAIQVVVDETKRASHVLFQEHEEISSAAQTMEAKYVEAQAESARLQNHHQQVEKQKEELASNVEVLNIEKRKLEMEVSDQTAEALKWKQSWEEVKALEEAQKKRTGRVEAELLQAKSVLVDASSAAAEAEASAATLRETIAELTTANAELHGRLRFEQASHREQQDSLEQDLQKAQQESHTLRLQSTASGAEIQKLKAENASCEQKMEQMQNKISLLERRLKDSPNLWASTGLGNTNTPDLAVTPSKTSLDKENGIASSDSMMCSICFKVSSGILKRCQCGQGCNHRAHATCINKIQAGPSVSHPGTPAISLPVILCKRQSSWVRQD